MALFPTTKRSAPITFRSFSYIASIGSILTLILLFCNTDQVNRIIPSSFHNFLPSFKQEPKETEFHTILPEKPSETELHNLLPSTTEKSSETELPLPSITEKPDDTKLFSKWKTAQSIDAHPINSLIENARDTHLEKLKARSYDLKTAAKKYRESRKRHPPPGFEKWVEYALQHDAILVESYFDRVYHDLQPFWAVDARVTAESAANWDFVVQVRNGKATPQGDTTGRVPWLQLWTDLVAECAQHLPDVDMPINYKDESRLLVPWTEIDRLVKLAQEKQQIIPVEEAIQEYKGGVLRQDLTTLGPEGHRPTWITNLETPIWDHVAAGCSPDSPSHGVPGLKDFTVAPELPSPDQEASYMESGYVKNATAATDPCQQPHLRGLHGSLIEPVSISISKDLFPLFGGSKLPTNNEILIPGAMYLTDDKFYSGGDDHGPEWKEKTSTMTWRGVASGGRHKAENWRHFQRLRLIEMLNGTTVSNMELHNGSAMTFKMPSATKYKSALGRPGRMGQWLSDNADAGFVELLCWPKETNCDYLSEYFHEVEARPMSEQYTSKFFADADGNSFSARYRALLLSTSVPFESTIYAMWHDDRLQPWLHYVPMDNTFQDVYGLLDYFTRDAKGDAGAQLIAETGKSWAEATLRREDMLLYVWRLLLEFARVCDENRDKLGFVDDLLVATTTGDKV